MKPIFQCDLKNGRRGFTDYGLLNGMAYYLGDDSGIAYSFKDETVQNGRTYYYAVVAYDYGIHPRDLKGTSVIATDESYGIAPSENNVVIRKNEFEEIDFIGPNVAIVTPGTGAAGLVTEADYEVVDASAVGNGEIAPLVVDPASLKEGHTYTVKFVTNVIDSAYRFHAGYGWMYTAAGVRIYDQTAGNSLVYEDVLMSDDNDVLTPKNMNTVLEYNDNSTSDAEDDFYHIATNEFKYTEIFDGLQLGLKMGAPLSEYDYLNSGWMPGEAPINIVLNEKYIKFYGWDYNIVFTVNLTYICFYP